MTTIGTATIGMTTHGAATIGTTTMGTAVAMTTHGATTSGATTIGTAGRMTTHGATTIGTTTIGTAVGMTTHGATTMMATTIGTATAGMTATMGALAHKRLRQLEREFPRPRQKAHHPVRESRGRVLECAHNRFVMASLSLDSETMMQPMQTNASQCQPMQGGWVDLAGMYT